MKFSWTKIDVISSVSQRGLALYWDRLERGASLPALSKFEPSERLHEAKLFMYSTIKFDGDRCRYLIDRYGSRLLDASGVDGHGKFLDTIIPEGLKIQALAAYDHCRLNKCLIYTVATTTDKEGRDVQYERLLLPFSEDQVRVDHIVSSLHLISTEGTFLRQGLLGSRANSLRYTLASMIKPGFTSGD